MYTCSTGTVRSWVVMMTAAMKVMVQVAVIVMVTERGWCSCSIGDSDGFSMVTVTIMVNFLERVGVILIGRLDELL